MFLDSEDPAVFYNIAIACTCAMLDMTKESITCLEKALRQGEWYKAWAEHDSNLDHIRSHPRFQALLKTI